jgi:hypothetical protein
LAILAGIDERFAVLPDSNLQQFLCLLDSMTAQLVNHERRKCYGASAAGFGFLQPDCLAGLLSTFDDSELRAFEIDITPP